MTLKIGLTLQQQKFGFDMKESLKNKDRLDGLGYYRNCDRQCSFKKPIDIHLSRITT